MKVHRVNVNTKDSSFACHIYGRAWKGDVEEPHEFPRAHFMGLRTWLPSVKEIAVTISSVLQLKLRGLPVA